MCLKYFPIFWLMKSIKLRRALWESTCCRVHVTAKIAVIALVSVRSASCVYHGFCYIMPGSPSPGDGICHADAGQRWCWVMDPLQLFVANDRLSVSDAAKKTFITEVSPPPVPLVTLSVAAPFVTLLLILHLKSFFSFGWIQTIMEVF